MEFNMYGQIYKITNNINNKLYVGQTTKNLEERLREHFQNADNLKNFTLSNAIRKYGKDNFSIDQIDTADTKDDLNKKEIYWINYYKSFDINYGYNMTLGGDGGNTYMNRSEDQMSITRKKISQKAKMHNSNHGQYVGELNSMYGKHQSDSAKQKISEKLKGRKNLNLWENI